MKIEKTTIGNDTVYVKKGWLNEYRVVFPIKNEDGSTNWKNLLIGSWTNLIMIIIAVSLILFLVWSYRHDVASLVKDSCNICKNITGINLK